MDERGNNTNDDVIIAVPDTGAARTAEQLARIGVLVGGQRTELFVRRGDGMELRVAWSAPGHESATDPWTDPIPFSWFPWSLGNIRPANHVFVRNAAALPLQPTGDSRVQDLGMGSCLHLPLHEGIEAIGAVCVYWVDERDDWPDEQAGRLAELGRTALELA